MGMCSPGYCLTQTDPCAEVLIWNLKPFHFFCPKILSLFLYNIALSSPILLMQCVVAKHSWYLSPAPPAVLVYFFQAGVQFSARNARGTVLSEVSWDCAMFVDLKYQTYQPKTKYNHSNNKYSPKWNSAVLLQEGFCREFTHFLAYFFQASIWQISGRGMVWIFFSCQRPAEEI